MLGEQFVGTDPVGVVVRDGGDDQFVRAGRVPQPRQALGHGLRRADELRFQPVGDQRPILVRPRQRIRFLRGGK